MSTESFCCKQQITANLGFKCCSETVELRDICVLNFKKIRKYSQLKRDFFFHQLLLLRLLSSQKTEKSVRVNQWNCLPRW